MNSTEAWKPNWIDYLTKKGKIQQLGALTAVQDLRAKAAENQRNSEAESAHVRRSVWDEDVEKSTESDDMGHTILGDVTHPAPIVITQPSQPQSNLLPIALAALAGLAIPTALAGGALAAYMLTKQPTTQQQPQTYQDETVSIGLGRIDDYKGATEK
jgi:hypothetical protein